MESPSGPEAEIRHTVIKHLEDFEHQLTEELVGKLTERKRSCVSLSHWGCGLIVRDAYR